MNYAVEPLLSAIVAAITNHGSYSERMNRVIDECARQRPHPDWQRMRHIAYESDTSALSSWLVETLDGVDPGLEIQGLWFGLNNPVIRGVTTADMYLGASESYSSDSLEWATDLIDLPNDEYLESKVLDAIYTEAYGRDGGLENDAEYPLVLAYGCICAIEASARARLVDALGDLRGTACGFDSGDALQLGQFKDETFLPHVATA